MPSPRFLAKTAPRAEWQDRLQQLAHGAAGTPGSGHAGSPQPPQGSAGTPRREHTRRHQPAWGTAAGHSTAAWYLGQDGPEGRAAGARWDDHAAGGPSGGLQDTIIPEVPPVRVPPQPPPAKPPRSVTTPHESVGEHIAEQLRLVAAGLAELLQDRMDTLERSLQEVVVHSLEAALASVQSDTGGPGTLPHRQGTARLFQSERSSRDRDNDKLGAVVEAQATVESASLDPEAHKGPLGPIVADSEANSEDTPMNRDPPCSPSGGTGAALWPIWRCASAREEENLLDIGVCIRLREMRKVKEILTRDASGANCSAKDPPCYVFLSSWVRHPTSTPVMIWLLIAPFLILYDVILIPMNAMPLPDLPIFHVFSFFCAVYWTIDISRLFFTGYEENNHVEMRLNRIMIRYLRTWFTLDFVSVLVDWAFLTMGVTGVFNKFWRTNRAMKSFRILRIFRLVRVMKYASQYRQIHDRLHSVQTLLLLKSLFVFLGVMMFLHYNGCYWYSLGDEYLILDSVTGHPQVTWISARGDEDSSIIDIYIAAVQWSLAQGGFSSTDIVPTNTFEHMYAVFTGFLWLIIVSVCISLYNKWLLEIREANRDFEKGAIDLRALLYQHSVSRNLMYKILGCYRATYKSQRRQTHEQDIEFMKNLPGTLTISLHQELYLPTLSKHAFFRILGNIDCELLTAVSHLAMFKQHVQAGESVFCEGEPAKHILYVCSGELDYYYMCTERNRLVNKRITKGDWACEPALWLQWKHHGRLVANSACEIIFINVCNVHAIAEQSERGGADMPSVRRFVVDVSDHFLKKDLNCDLWDDVGVIERIEQAHFGSQTPVEHSGSLLNTYKIW